MSPVRVAIVGNPNVGKTSLFNQVTGARHSVGNYPGITVEVREGAVRRELHAGEPIVVLDLPGIYTTTALSEDEALAFEVLTAGQRPDAVVVVVDATNLARNLYLVLQVLELGLPCVVALNMIDVARAMEVEVDADDLAATLGAAVIPTVARSGEGTRELVAAVQHVMSTDVSPRVLPPGSQDTELATVLEKLEQVASPSRARWLLSAQVGRPQGAEGSETELLALAELGTELCETAIAQLVARRYTEVDRILAEVATEQDSGGVPPTMAFSRRIDRILTHPIGGFAVFFAMMAILFQGLFTWSDPLIGLIESGVGGLSALTRGWLGPGPLTDLLTEGVIAGVGNVIVFVPQIALLFLFVGLLEDTGYLARAAFLIDRLMSKVGLNGKSFVPLLSGYACAIPAVMSTRTIVGFRDRLVTIMMIPFMSCSARLPVFALIIAALFDATRPVVGPFTVGGLLLLFLYVLSTASALAVGAVYKHTVLRGPTPSLVLELPPYRRPRVRNTLVRVYDRTMDFIRAAGTIIMAVTIVLWALLTYPKIDPAELPPGETAIEHSVGGRFGKAVEPLLEPIGQDWRMGIGLIGSFAAREVLVSTLGLVYGIEGADEEDAPLRQTLRTATDPTTGKPRYTPLRGLALMIFFVYACQCASTLAVVKRETRSWRWPLIMLGSMTVIAYVMALLVYQGGRLLGFE